MLFMRTTAVPGYSSSMISSSILSDCWAVAIWISQKQAASESNASFIPELAMFFERLTSAGENLSANVAVAALLLLPRRSIWNLSGFGQIRNRFLLVFLHKWRHHKPLSASDRDYESPCDSMLPQTVSNRCCLPNRQISTSGVSASSLSLKFNSMACRYVRWLYNFLFISFFSYVSSELCLCKRSPDVLDGRVCDYNVFLGWESIFKIVLVILAPRHRSSVIKFIQYFRNHDLIYAMNFNQELT